MLPASLEGQVGAGQSWQQMPPQPAVSAQSRITHGLCLMRTEELAVLWGPSAATRRRLLKFLGSKRKSILCKCIQDDYLQTLEFGIGVGTASCLGLSEGETDFPSSPTNRMQLWHPASLIPSNTLETKRWQHATLNSDKYKVPVSLCWVTLEAQIENNYPFPPW